MRRDYNKILNTTPATLIDTIRSDLSNARYALYRYEANVAQNPIITNLVEAASHMSMFDTLGVGVELGNAIIRGIEEWHESSREHSDKNVNADRRDDIGTEHRARDSLESGDDSNQSAAQELMESAEGHQTKTSAVQNESPTDESTASESKITHAEESLASMGDNEFRSNTGDELATSESMGNISETSVTEERKDTNSHPDAETPLVANATVNAEFEGESEAAKSSETSYEESQDSDAAQPSSQFGIGEEDSLGDDLAIRYRNANAGEAASEAFENHDQERDHDVAVEGDSATQGKGVDIAGAHDGSTVAHTDTSENHATLQSHSDASLTAEEDAAAMDMSDGVTGDQYNEDAENHSIVDAADDGESSSAQTTLDETGQNPTGNNAGTDQDGSYADGMEHDAVEAEAADLSESSPTEATQDHREDHDQNESFAQDSDNLEDEDDDFDSAW